MSKDNTNDNAKWYIISCYSGHEDKVAELIKQSVEANGMDHKVLDVMVPKQTKIVVQGGKKKEVDEKVFPGYVLVQMEIDDNTWQLIRSVEGVTKFIGGVKKPTPLTEEQVKSIVDYTQVSQPSYTAKFAVNDAVKVNDGPFKDFVGKINKINEDKGRVEVLLTMFGRETPVDLDFLQIVRL